MVTIKGVFSWLRGRERPGARPVPQDTDTGLAAAGEAAVLEAGAGAPPE